MDDVKKTYLTRAVRRYKSLFTFPEYWVLLLLMFLVNVLGCIIAFVIILSSIEMVYRGFLFGIQVLIIPPLITDVILTRIITRDDAIFNLKRSGALSLSSCGIWIIILIAGSLLQKVLGISTILSYASIFAFSIVVSMRFLVFISVTQLKLWKTVFSIALQPSTSLILTLVFWSLWNPHILLMITLSSAIMLTATLIFVHLVNKKGEAAIGIGAIPLFKGFLANWLSDLTYPLEGYFEKLGSNTEVSTAILAFRTKEHLKTFMVVPAIHPGPFRNLGSSNLPYMVQKSLEERFNVITMVPHGTSGHELDLTSQSQSEKVVKEIINLTTFSTFNPKATRLVRAEANMAKATCQFFGELALITVTCAPKNMEDIPLETGLEIIKRGIELGAKDMVVIDAHNSIGSSKEVPILSEEELQALKLAAERSLEVALKEPKESFEVGVAKMLPEEFNLAKGFGLGGITALTVSTGGQKIAYVTIDGNNMVSGLREKIHQSLRDLVVDCEVLTTDTHIVNAVTSIERGYNPIGEVIDHERLISYIRSTVSNALSTMQESEFAYNLGKIKDVKVIGEEKLVNLSKLVDSTFRYMTRLAPAIFIPALVSAILSFVLLPL